MIQYPLTHAKGKEEDIKKEILPLISIHNEIYITNKASQKKLITFTYFGPETKATINLFRNTHIGIA
jgi:hypothetical protein